METKEIPGGKIQVYKNVNREAMMFGLPASVFWIFLSIGIPILFISIMLPHVLKAAALMLGCGVYGALWALVEKFGVHFFKKLIAHYTEPFTMVRKNHTARRIVQAGIKPKVV